jgi:hypothetical protein
MKHIKLFEYYNQYYFKINQTEFTNILTNPNLHSFTDVEIKLLNEFAKKHDIKTQYIPAKTYPVRIEEREGPTTYYKTLNEWHLIDTCGMDTYIESPYIYIHKDNDVKRYHVSEIAGDDDEITLDNFTAILSKKGLGYKIEITKCDDEWFLASWEIQDSAMMYKCDQFSGLIKFLEEKYEIH